MVSYVYHVIFSATRGEIYAWHSTLPDSPKSPRFQTPIFRDAASTASTVGRNRATNLLNEKVERRQRPNDEIFDKDRVFLYTCCSCVVPTKCLVPSIENPSEYIMRCTYVYM